MKAFKLLLIILFVFFVSSHAQNNSSRNGQLISLNGTELFVEIMGSGEPIIVIHGGPVLDHGYLEPHFKTLAESYQLVFFDQRLSGRSSAKVDTTDIHMEMFIEDIEALRNSLQTDKVHILGHSWGGLLAMKYALKYPLHTETLILLNAMPPSTALWQKEQKLLAQAVTKEDSLKRQEIIQSGFFKNNPSEAVKQLLFLSFKNQFHNPELVESLDFYIPEDYMVRSRSFGRLMPELSNYNLTDNLSTLNMPVLIIYGSKEPAGTLSGPVIHKQIPESEFRIIKKSGHFPFIEQPQEFNRTILSFLKRHSRQ